MAENLQTVVQGQPSMREKELSRKEAPAVLLALANLFASFAGGSMIGMATRHAGVGLLSFLAGTAIGLVLLLLSHRIRTFTSLPVLSAVAAALSIGALVARDEPTRLAVILAVYFSAWFLGRTTRMGAAAGRRMVVGAVDGTYYLGTVLGLLTLPKSIAFAAFLVLNAALLLIATLLDLYCVKTTARPSSEARTARGSSSLVLRREFFAATLSLAALTVAVQITIFARARWPDLDPHFSSVTASVYAGFAFAAFVAFFRRVAFVENPESLRTSAFLLRLNLSRERTTGTSASVWGVAAVIASLTAAYHYEAAHGGSILLVCVLAAAASMVYEFLALAIINWLGVLSKEIHASGLPAMAYGFTGSVSVPALLFFESPGPVAVVAIGLIVVGILSLDYARRASR